MAFTDAARIKNRMDLAQTESVDTTGMAELIVDGHAEVISIIRDYGLDADDIDTNYTDYDDYQILIAGETEVCIGLLYHSRPPQNEFVKYSMKSQHPTYEHGIQLIHNWCKKQVENAVDDQTYSRVVKSAPTQSVDFKSDYGTF